VTLAVLEQDNSLSGSGDLKVCNTTTTHVPGGRDWEYFIAIQDVVLVKTPILIILAEIQA
jgi:hypothetical protein